MPDSAAALLAEMDAVFDLGPWTLVPLGVVLGGVALRVAPALALVASSVVAMILGAAVQGFSVQSVLASAVRGFEPMMVAAWGSAATGKRCFAGKLGSPGLASGPNARCRRG